MFFSSLNKPVCLLFYLVNFRQNASRRIPEVINALGHVRNTLNVQEFHLSDGNSTFLLQRLCHGQFACVHNLNGNNFSKQILARQWARKVVSEEGSMPETQIIFINVWLIVDVKICKKL